MFSFFGQKQSKYQQAKDLVKRIESAEGAEYVPLFKEIPQYIPDYTEFMMKSLLSQFLDPLVPDKKPSELLDVVLDILLMMIQKYDNTKSNTNPFGSLLSNSSTLEYLFGRKGFFDQRIIQIIEGMYQPCLQELQTFAKKSIQTLRNAISNVIVSKNARAGKLIQRIICSKPEISSLYVNDLRPILKQLPPGVAADFMVAIPALQSVIPLECIEEWLIPFHDLTISDVQLYTQFYPDLWQRPGSIALLLRSNPMERDSTVDFIHDRPIQTFAVSARDAEDIGLSLTKPPKNFPKIVEKEEINDSRNSYFYLRIYLASLTNPSALQHKAISVVYQLLYDSNIYVSAAAAQTILIWFTNFGYRPEKRILPGLCGRSAELAKRIKAIFDGPETIGKAKTIEELKSLRNLFNLLISLFATKYAAAASIIMLESQFRYDATFKIKLMRNVWVFPLTKDLIKKMPAMTFCNLRDSLEILGILVSTLGLTVDQIVPASVIEHESNEAECTEHSSHP